MTWESIQKEIFSLITHIPLASDHICPFPVGLKAPRRPAQHLNPSPSWRFFPPPYLAGPSHPSAHFLKETFPEFPPSYSSPGLDTEGLYSWS